MWNTSFSNFDVKKFNYVKRKGAVREQQQKITHLEASVYGLQEAMKEVMKTKPKPKAKVKAKAKEHVIKPLKNVKKVR